MSESTYSFNKLPLIQLDGLLQRVFLYQTELRCLSFFRHAQNETGNLIIIGIILNKCVITFLLRGSCFDNHDE